MPAIFLSFRPRLPHATHQTQHHHYQAKHPHTSITDATSQYAQAATHRPLPRLSESPAATHRPLPRPPPAESPAATHGPLPRPPGRYNPMPTSSPPLVPYHPDPSPPGRGRASSALASCLAATAFLLLAAGGAVPALPAAAAGHRRGGRALAGLRDRQRHHRLHLRADRRRPQPQPLAHLDSLLRVAYAGVSELGCAYILAGLINTSQHINFYY
jgi:hypothetical protein